MNPGMVMALISLASTAYGALSGNKGEMKSPYSKKQKRFLEDIMNDVRNMKGGAQDITQQPGYQQGNEWLMSMFNDPEFFKSFEAPLQRQFQEEIVPGLANRFASMGSGGSLGSTGFRNQLAREGSNLSTNIANLRGQMQQGAIPQLLSYSQQPFSNLMSLYGLALGQPQNTVYQPPSQGVGALATPFAQGAAQYYANQYPGTNQGGLSGGNIRFTGQSPVTT